MIIAKEKRRQEIHLNGENLEEVEGYKYLGTFIEGKWEIGQRNE